MNQRIFLGEIIPVDNVNMEEVLVFIKNSLDDKSAKTSRIIIAQNATKAACCYYDLEFRDQMSKADLLLPDGMAILVSARILGHYISSRITGIDVMEKMLHIANSEKRKVFFLGGKESICAKLAENVGNQFPNLTIANVVSGYFSKEQETKIIKSINKAKTDILLVALGSPKQEKWLFSNRKLINAKICIGVGGSFDIIAGTKKRAPRVFIKYGMEGAYRIFKEPYRLLRLKVYMTLTYFTIRSWLKTRVFTLVKRKGLYEKNHIN